MIKILICCLGGFSSSAMVTKIKNEITDNNLENKVYVEFSPFGRASKVLTEFDVVMVCPHIRYEVANFVKDNPDLDKPIYVLQPKMYGHMTAMELYIDAKDILEGFKETKLNPWHFPGEESIINIKRGCSYRSWKEQGEII